MSVQVELLDNNMAKLTIEVSPEELDAAMEHSYNKQKNSVSMPGFRKGKVPRQMMEKMYGPGIFYEDAANELIPKAYADAYDESGLEIVSQPDISVEQIEKGKPFIFTAEVAVKPGVTLGEYKGVPVDKVSIRVTQKEVDEKIQEEANKNARSVTVEDRPVQDGDNIILDFEGFIDGEPFEGGKAENYPLTIGSHNFIPGFEEKLIGANPEEELDVEVTFPEDYQVEDLKGKDAVFKCTIHEIKTNEVPDIDDEFAAEVSEFDTLDEYKADVKRQIKEQKEEDAKRQKEDQALEAAMNNAEMDIPDPMIETQARQMVDEFAQQLSSQGLTLDQYCQYAGIDQDQLLEQMKPQALDRIKSRLTLEAIVDAENIEVSEERYEEELAKMAENYGMEVDDLKKMVGDTEKEQMMEDMAVQDALDFIVENAVETKEAKDKKDKKEEKEEKKDNNDKDSEEN